MFGRAVELAGRAAGVVEVNTSRLSRPSVRFASYIILVSDLGQVPLQAVAQVLVAGGQLQACPRSVGASSRSKPGLFAATSRRNPPGVRK